MSPSPGIPMHPSILLIIALIYMNHESVVALEPVLQRTIIEEAQSLNLTKNEVDSSTQSSFVSLLICGSPQCQLCLGTCNQCTQCQTCQRFCGNKVEGFCKRCSYCHGGQDVCRRRCKRDQAANLCSQCYHYCQVTYLRS